MFGALLDPERGGHFRIRPAGADVTTKQLYLPDTAILITRFLTEDGVGEVVDFMPPGRRRPPRTGTGWSGWCRCVRGRDDVRRSTCAPRFDYGRHAHTTSSSPTHGAVFDGRRHRR